MQKNHTGDFQGKTIRVIFGCNLPRLSDRNFFAQINVLNRI